MPGPGNPKFLKPAKPGEVRNPKGINQYTYRAEAEAYFAKVLREIDKGSGKRNLEVILDGLVELAKTKRGRHALDRVLERMLPAIQKHEHEGEIHVASSDSLASGLARSARARRANGRDREADDTAEAETG